MSKIAPIRPSAEPDLSATLTSAEHATTLADLSGIESIMALVESVARDSAGADDDELIGACNALALARARLSEVTARIDQAGIRTYHSQAGTSP